MITYTNARLSLRAEQASFGLRLTCNGKFHRSASTVNEQTERSKRVTKVVTELSGFRADSVRTPLDSQRKIS